MRLGSVVQLLYSFAITVRSQTQWPLHTDGYNNAVEWYVKVKNKVDYGPTLSGTITATSSMDKGSTFGLAR